MPSHPWVLWSSAAFRHDAEALHGAMERDRLLKITNRVSQVSGITLQEARPATDQEMAWAHNPAWIDHLVRHAPTKAGQYFPLDGETVMNRHTLLALRESAGAAIDAVREVWAGNVPSAFCIGYAGHHAAAQDAHGFCFTNPVAIAAFSALNLGVTRVAIVDVDTHSGDGTAKIVAGHDRIRFAETYQPGFPGVVFPHGAPSNVWREKVTNATSFRHAWERLLIKLTDFDPDLMLVSAGFDAHQSDPLGTIGLADSAYGDLVDRLLKICPKMVAVLEGGYHLETAGRCAALVVSRMVQAAQDGSHDEVEESSARA